MILERGTLLNNRYKIVEILGQGGMGSVYRAIDENLGVEVAVKDNLFTTDDYARQFRLEATILATLRHPNLPRVTDHFVIEGQGQYLVMDYIEGEDLRQRMERAGLLSEEEISTIGAAVCDALTYLGTRNPPIVHRDIKPGNVRISPHGGIFLVDFGLAKTLRGSQATTTGARAMTPGFSPPEQYGTARTDQRSDIFSLGATLYAALTGNMPEDALARAMDQSELTPIRKYNPRISKRMASTIEKAIDVRPDDRYQTAEEFKQALLSSSGKHKEGDYQVTPPPPEEEKKPSPIEAAADVLVSAELDGKMASTSGQLLPLSASAQEFEQVRPRSKPRRRGSRLGCWIAFLLVIALFAVGGVIVYQYAPGLPSRAVAQLWPLIVEPQASATNTALSLQSSVTPTITLPSPTFTATSTATLTPTPTSTPEPTATPTPRPTSTYTPVPTPMGGGGRIAYASKVKDSVQIYVINTDGSGVTQVTNMPEGACQPSWSPDAKRIVFTSPCTHDRTDYPGSALYIINLDGTGVLPLPTMAGGDYDPAWSPDGTKILFTSLRNSNRPQLYVLNIEDSSVNALSENYGFDMQGSWSTDGKHIIFVSIRRGPAQIWVMDADGKNPVQFSRSQGFQNYHPSWSPDGQQVLFTQYVGDSGIPRVDIAPYNFDDYREYRMTQEPIPMRDAVFSPDGYWVAFEGWPAGGNHDIYFVAVSGAGRTQITNDPYLDFDACWCPIP